MNRTTVVSMLLAGALQSVASTSFAQTAVGLGALETIGALGREAGNVGKRFNFVCAASDGAGAKVEGTDTYTDSSAVCAAAIHAGVLKPGQAGAVSIVIGAGAESFKGTARNGVTSRSYGRWGYSYTFARDSAPGTVTWKTVWNWVPRDFTAALPVTCPPGGKTDGAIWGTDVYTRESTICVAAVHAGVISPQLGGVVVVTRAPAPPEYPGTDRNGIVSRRWGSAPDAFSVTASPAVAAAVLAACPLATAVERAFAAMRTSVTNEFATLAPVAQGANGFDATTLTAQRDGLLADLAQFESQNTQAGWNACAAGIRMTRATPSTPEAVTGLGRGSGNSGPVRDTGTSRATPAAQPTPPPSAPPAVPASGPNVATQGTQAFPRGAVVADPSVSPTLSVDGPTGPPPADFRVYGFPGTAHLSWTIADSIRTFWNTWQTSDDPFGAQSTEEDGAVVGYKLYRSDGANWTELAPRWDASTGRYSDVVPASGVTYTYRLVARYPDDTVGEARISWLAPPPVNPTNVSARFTSSSAVTLEWDDAPGASEYRIDGTGLPNTGKTVRETIATISPHTGNGSWQVAAIYPGGNVDYANRPTATVTTTPVPTHAPAWLSMRNGQGNSTETARHYARLCNPRYQPEDGTSIETFCGSLSGVLMSWGATENDATFGPGEVVDFGVPRRGEASVGYTNTTELASHRTTYCHPGSSVPGGGGIICHSETSNGLSLIIMNAEGARFAAYERLPPRPPVTSDDYYNGNYQPWLWGKEFRLVPTATVDSEGPKAVPHACLSCHGGQYNPTTGLVTGASLLPIDPTLVALDGHDPNAQEKIRLINSVIRRTYSSPAVAAYIDGLYGGTIGNQRGVDIPGTPALADYVPQGWAPQQRNLYLDFVKKDCAMCHLAGPSNLNFLSASNFFANKNLVHAAVCSARSMPHAEVSFKRFWTSGSAVVSGPGWFAAALGFDRC